MPFLSPIRFFRQSTDWTCGPAALRIALSALGISTSEKALSRLMHTARSTGTKNNAFISVAKKFGLNARWHDHANLSHLSRLMARGFAVIVGYYLEKEKEGHYAVVKKITAKSVFLFDPLLGPRTRYPRRTFLRVWKNNPAGLDRKKRWFVALRQKS